MSSHDSTPSSPASTSSTLTEERTTRTMADVIRKYKTEELIDYLRRQEDLSLDNDDFTILRKRKIAGLSFLEMTKEDFRECGFEIGPAITLAKFVEELSEQKLRSFSSYKTVEELKELLKKYKVNGEKIENIKQFCPVFEEIDDNDESLNQCMSEIVLRLTNVKSMIEANEATRCEFISSILHASIAIARRLTKKEISIELQSDISGEEASGRVDYAISGVEDLLCITEGKPRNVKIGYLQNIKQLESSFHTNKKKRTVDEAFKAEDYDYLYGIVSTGADWHFIMFTSEGIFCTSNSEYQINLTKKALKGNQESLREDIKQVVSIVVGLLKDRVLACDEPENKKRCVQEKITKK